MKGFLEKRSGKFRIYQLRYFELQASQLKYFRNKGESVPRGVINLYNLCRIDFIESVNYKSTKSEFVVVSEGREYMFRADCCSTRAAWIEQLQVWVKAESPQIPVDIPLRTFKGIMQCIDYCKQHAAFVEGLFRVPGNDLCASSIETCVFMGDEATVQLIEHSDPFDVASALKKLLRSLPEPIFTTLLVPEFQKAESAERILQLILQLPLMNKKMLQNLISLCHLLYINSDITLMTPASIAVCLAPTIGVPNTYGLFRLNSFFNLSMKHFDQLFPNESEHNSTDTFFTASLKSNPIVSSLMPQFDSLAGTEDTSAQIEESSGLMDIPGNTFN